MKTILVVEDTEALRHVIARALERAGYNVLVASSGPHALMVMDFGGAKIDLLITDLELAPGMSGAEVAIEVNARRPGLPVLYMSGAHPDAGPVEHFLAKPFPMEELVSRVAAIIADAERSKDQGER